MKKKIFLSLLILVSIFVITGCNKNKEVEENDQYSVVATYIVLTPENNGKDITNDSQIIYQDDLSNEIVSMYNSQNIIDQIYEKYKFKIIPTVKSLNEKNTKYETKLYCGNLNQDDCINVLKIYNEEFLNKGEINYKLYIKCNDNYTITK